MIIGHYIKPAKPRKRGTKPASKIRVEAEKRGLTYDQVYPRMKRYGLTLEEALAYRPKSHAEAGSMGGQAKARRRANGTQNGTQE